MLDVGDGNRVYWQVGGNPDGKPALVMLGSPGSGCSTGFVEFSIRTDTWVVLFDQRGCDSSIPHASDPATDMNANITEHLLSDIERLREHLSIGRWLLSGGSSGSTLILAHNAERSPHRVSEIVISSVTTPRRSEIDWLYQGVARFYPKKWERFRAGVPEADRDGDLVAAYGRLVEGPNPLVRAQTTNAWCALEDAVISLEQNGKPNAFSDRPPVALLAFVGLCAHYFAHGAWLEEGALLHDAGRLAGIPGVLGLRKPSNARARGRTRAERRSLVSITRSLMSQGWPDRSRLRPGLRDRSIRIHSVLQSSGADPRAGRHRQDRTADPCSHGPVARTRRSVARVSGPRLSR
jgi:proline iminopeptidase